MWVIVVSINNRLKRHWLPYTPKPLYLLHHALLRARDSAFSKAVPVFLHTSLRSLIVKTQNLYFDGVECGRILHSNTRLTCSHLWRELVHSTSEVYLHIYLRRVDGFAYWWSICVAFYLLQGHGSQIFSKYFRSIPSLIVF